MLRTLISLAIAILSVIGVYLYTPTYAVMPKGIFLPSASVLIAPQQGRVDIIENTSMPSHGKVLGIISVEYHNKSLSQRAMRHILEKAKSLAASAGGNALKISLGHTGAATPPAMSMLVLRGTVIQSDERTPP